MTRRRLTSNSSEFGTSVSTALAEAKLTQARASLCPVELRDLVHLKPPNEGTQTLARAWCRSLPCRRGAIAARKRRGQRQWREIGLGAQILKDLGISWIRLLTSAEHRYVGLAGFGIEIASSEPIA